MPAEETPFFDDPYFGSGNPEHLERLFAGAHTPLRGIKRPNYLAQPEVPPRIRAMLPDAKIIAILREPVSRFLSAYHYYIKIGIFPAVPVDEALPRLFAGECLGSPYAHELLEYGRYAVHLRRYLDEFPHEQLLILLQEDFNARQEQTLNRMTDFLGTTRFKDPPKVSRDNAGLYSIPRLQFLRMRNRFLFCYDPKTAEFRQKGGVLNYVAAGAITAVDRGLLSRFLHNEKPRLPPALLGRLQDYYGPEIDALESMLGRSLDAWRPGHGD